MTDQSAPELPAEVLERIFSTDRPRSEPAEPLLDTKQRVSVTAWDHAHQRLHCVESHCTTAATAAAAAALGSQALTCAIAH